MDTIKRVILICVVLCFILTIATAGQKVESPNVNVNAEVGVVTQGLEDYMPINEVNDRSLLVDLSTGNVVVRDHRSDTLWYTTPPTVDSIADIGRETLNNLKSHLTVTYLTEMLNETTVNSADCIAKDTYEVLQVHGGLKFIYHFESDGEQFSIPVEFTLEKDYMQVRILYDDIREYGKSKITRIDLLPWFGAGAADEEGYLFIPDGSGSLVDFADNTRDAPTYRMPVYGSDPAVDLLLKTTAPAQSIHMPVYGIKKANSAILAVIHEGDCAAQVFSVNSSEIAPYCGVGSSFIYHQTDLTGIREKSGNLRTVMMLQDKPLDITPTVRYYFLNDEDADYSGMARQYRRYLMEEKGLKQIDHEDSASPSVSLQFYGLTSRPSNFIGIPTTKPVVATTFEQITDFITRIEVDNPIVQLYGFENGGYNNKYHTKQNFDKKTGGKSGYQKLLDATGGMVYTAYDLLRDYSGSIWEDRYVRSLNKARVTRKQPLLSTGDWDDKRAAWKYKNLLALKNSAKSLLKSVERKSNAGTLLMRFASEIPSDFNAKNPNDRQQTVDAYTGIMQAWDAPLAAEGGNVYVAPYVGLISDVPAQSSKHLLFSRDIPFYSMVLHGYVRLSSQPLNNAPDRKSAVSMLLLSGIIPTYQLTGVNPDELENSELDFLFNSGIEQWEGEIQDSLTRYSVLLNGLDSVPIRSHSKTGDLEVTTFENGVKIVANTGHETIQYLDATVSSGEVCRIDPEK